MLLTLSTSSLGNNGYFRPAGTLVIVGLFDGTGNIEDAIYSTGVGAFVRLAYNYKGTDDVASGDHLQFVKRETAGGLATVVDTGLDGLACLSEGVIAGTKAAKVRIETYQSGSTWYIRFSSSNGTVIYDGALAGNILTTALGVGSFICCDPASGSGPGPEYRITAIQCLHGAGR